MNIIKQELLNNEFAGNNLVLVKMPQSYNEYLHSFYDKQVGGTSIKIVTSGNPGEHCPRYGELIKNPQKLIYDRQHWNESHSLPHKTHIETLPHDLVFFDYRECMNSLGKLANPVSTNTRAEKWFRCENDLYALLSYRSLLFAIRGKVEWQGQIISNLKDLQVVSLNGYAVVEFIYNDVKSSLIIEKKKDPNRTKVVYLGQPNIENGDKLIDALNINVGDTVISRPIQVPLETKITGVLGNNNLAYLARKFIFAKQILT